MDEFALVVLGAIVGALATGGMQWLDATRQRRLRRMVAARLILGDLFVVEGACKVLVEHHRWSDRRLPFQSALDTWRESRVAFAGGVKAWEWALVDGCFSNLQRTIPMIRLSETTTSTDEDVLSDLRDAATKAQAVVEPHTASRRDRKETVKELQKRHGVKL